MADRTPPRNEDAEQSVLGAILIDKDSIGLVSQILAPEDFYNDINGIIYDGMLSLYEERKPIDVVTLGREFKKIRNGDKVETAYLSELVNSVPTAANIEHYANLVKEASTKRSLIRVGTEIAENSFQEKSEVGELLDKAESSIFSISQGRNLKGFVPLKDSLAASFDRIDELHKKGAGYRGVKTG